jgi:aminoglycoside phosphotransferase (APT) family kinase protein
MAGTRLEWSQLPSMVNDAVERFLGQHVVAAASQAWGFSPALASRLTLEDGGTVFVKAIAPDEQSGAPGGSASYRREAAISEAMPEGVPVPRLVAMLEPSDWVVLVFEDVDGRHPTLPWEEPELSRVLDAMDALTHLLTPSPLDVPKATPPGGGGQWETLASEPSLLDRLTSLDPWAPESADRLARLTVGSVAAYEGTTMLHSDIRADNVLLTEDRVVFVDWPHAQVGAPWIDLLYFEPSVAMQGGPDPSEVFWHHPAARGADRDAVIHVLADLAGFFIYGATQEAPPGLPTLRTFQLAQGVEAVKWLREMVD